MFYIIFYIPSIFILIRDVFGKYMKYYFEIKYIKMSYGEFDKYLTSISI